MSRYHVGVVGTRRWQRARREVFERDGWRCMDCGRSGRLECDHVVPLSRGGDPWAMSNLATRCRSCHIAKTRGERPPPVVPEAVRRWRELVADLLD